MTVDVDAVIAGGGVAGTATAAALSALGWSVLIVEPGHHLERRLAGEWIHPIGVAGLARLGLLFPALDRGARLDGFAVYPGSDTRDRIELMYSRSLPEQSALALDHASIYRGLLQTVEMRSGVGIARGWRVTGLGANPAEPVVQIRQAGVTETVTCRLVVGADGACSPTRGHIGIGYRRKRTSVLTGYLVGAGALPVPGRGHVFTGTAGAVLAYPIGGERARVLFNQPLSSGSVKSAIEAPCIALPSRLQAQVAGAVAAGTGQRFVSSDITVSDVTRGRLVLVGDAAGSCHPISASGMTMGIDDALRLQSALCRCDGEPAKALLLYATERRSRQRARALMATLLHEVLAGVNPDMGLLRAGMHRYWSHSARHRAASMLLLSMEDLRVRSVLIEFLRVVAASLFESRGEAVDTLRLARLMAQLSLPLMRQVVWSMHA